MKPEMEEPDERGASFVIDKDVAALIIGTYRNINRLKKQVQALPYFQSVELMAGSNALTHLLNNALEDVPMQAVLQSLASGITLTQHLIMLNADSKVASSAIANTLKAILTDFQLLQSNINLSTK